ncbi:unnamed protein product [Caenorhabditis auriculariae]|uniref:FLYWCH-type domain-containing protein n=1 Tax=Caenorhabditis auriculariae TaxID=2777116 RepID=A0A8S1HM59_9PELO|nr:unnamed protein product [Caenorhabditis auriculariae]
MERRDDLQHVLMPNQQEENLPESDDWRMEERPAMEVVVGQGSVEGEFVEVDDIGQVDHVIELGQHHEYEDGFPSLLPIRDGAPLLTLNLPDLISKSIPFANGEKMIICFNKKCSRQIAFAGYLYSISGYLEENSWNLWKCVNENCDGSVRTSPNCLELRVRTEHISSCVPDDAQIRLRIAIYDLRLMAEFTDLSLQLLFAGNESRMKADNGDIAHLMPSFETLRTTLEDHRVNKANIYLLVRL